MVDLRHALFSIYALYSIDNMFWYYWSRQEYNTLVPMNARIYIP